MARAARVKHLGVNQPAWWTSYGPPDVPTPRGKTQIPHPSATHQMMTRILHPWILRQNQTLSYQKDLELCWLSTPKNLHTYSFPSRALRTTMASSIIKKNFTATLDAPILHFKPSQRRQLLWGITTQMNTALTDWPLSMLILMKSLPWWTHSEALCIMLCWRT